MSKENITVDDLTVMLSDIKQEQMELIRGKPEIFPNIRLNAMFEGKVDVLLYMFHFLGLGTEEELAETKDKIMDEMKKEIRRMQICQI